MKIVAREKWKPSDGIVLESNADVAVQINKNVLVVAGPGAGKTELLAQKANFLFQTNACKDPQKILAISFKKDAADNLKKRVIRRCGREIESRFISMTYDAFSKNILDHFRFALPNELRPDATYLVNDTETIDAAFNYVGKPSSSLSLRQKEDIIESVKFPFSGNDLGIKVWKLLLNGFDNYKPTLSFKMICMLANYIIMTNPKIKRALQLTYKYVFLDEFQDTTNLQYEFVKQCFGNSDSMLTAVGDSKQRIMVWAGARKTVFDDFRTDFNSTICRLTMNHRSAPRLVDLQKRMYASLNEQECDIGISEKWSSDDGKVTLFIAGNEDDEANFIAERIAEKVSSGIEPNKLCILCKQRPQNYTSYIVEALKKYHIRARIENNYQDLIKEPIIEMIISMLCLTFDRIRPQDWEFIVLQTAELWDLNSLQSNDDYFRMQEHIDSELQKLKEIISGILDKKDFKILINHIIQFWGEKRIKAMFPAYRQGTYLNDIVNNFQDYMWDELEYANMNWMIAIENFEGLHSVPIMTIHKSKGLEYEAVYFVGLEDSAFWNFKNQPEEDRCAFFVALSRAKKEIMFTFCNYRCTSRNPKQSHDQINEFFELLKTPDVANLIEC